MSHSRERSSTSCLPPTGPSTSETPLRAPPGISGTPRRLHPHLCPEPHRPSAQFAAANYSNRASPPRTAGTSSPKNSAPPRVRENRKASSAFHSSAWKNLPPFFPQSKLPLAGNSAVQTPPALPTPRKTGPKSSVFQEISCKCYTNLDAPIRENVRRISGHTRKTRLSLQPCRPNAPLAPLSPPATKNLISQILSAPSLASRKFSKFSSSTINPPTARQKSSAI